MYKQALIMPENNGLLALSSTYDADFVEGLKASIPACEREWNGPKRMWVISEQYYPSIVSLLRFHRYSFNSLLDEGDVERCAQSTAESNKPFSGKIYGYYRPIPDIMPDDLLQAFLTFHLWWDASFEACEAVYEAMLRIHDQPHHGGGNKEQKEILDRAINTIRRYKNAYCSNA